MFSYLLPTILLVLALGAVVILVLRRLPEATKAEQEEKGLVSVSQVTAASGLGGLFGRFRKFFGFWIQRAWHFILEAKEIKPPAVVRYRAKKMLRKSEEGDGLPFSSNTQEQPGHVAVSASPVSKASEAGTPKNEEQELLEAIKHDPKNPTPFLNLAKFYTDRKQWEEARDIYDFLVKREPGNSSIYAKLAFCFYKLEQFSEAVLNYEKSLALDSAQPNRYYNLGLSLDAMKKSDQAIVALKKAIELEPSNSKYSDTLLATYVKLGRTEEAKIFREQLQARKMSSK